MSQAQIEYYGSHASAVWLTTIAKVLREGTASSPRGQPTIELTHHAVHVDLARPLVACPRRKLSVRFAAAEALWILAGDDRLAPVARFAPQLAQFSDDGARLTGAYGPRVVAQLGYVVAKLLEDRDTRQAVLTTWVPNPPSSKDIPCTLALTFAIRRGRLHCHAFMRSSDVWLGLPYDVFSFSMIAAKVACLYNQQVATTPRSVPDAPPEVELGTLHLTAASSHLYERNVDGVRACLADEELGLAFYDPDPVPAGLVLGGDWLTLEAALVAARDATVTDATAWRLT